MAKRIFSSVLIKVSFNDVDDLMQYTRYTNSNDYTRILLSLDLYCAIEQKKCTKTEDNSPQLWQQDVLDAFDVITLYCEHL